LSHRLSCHRCYRHRLLCHRRYRHRLLLLSSPRLLVRCSRHCLSHYCCYLVTAFRFFRLIVAIVTPFRCSRHRHRSFVAILSLPLPFVPILSPPLLVRYYPVNAIAFRCYLVTATARSLLSRHCRFLSLLSRNRHCSIVAILSPSRHRHNSFSSLPLLVCCYIVTAIACLLLYHRNCSSLLSGRRRCSLVALSSPRLLVRCYLSRSLVSRNRECSLVAILVTATARSLLSSPPLLVGVVVHGEGQCFKVGRGRKFLMACTCRLLSTNQNVTIVEIEALTEKSTKKFSQQKSQDLGKLTF